MSAAVPASYARAVRHVWSFTMVRICVGLAVSALLVPLGALILGLALSFSAAGAVTDQEIARFLLSPAGFAGGLIFVSFVIVGAVLDVSVMSAALWRGAETPGETLGAGLALLRTRLVSILRFAMLLVLRVLALALPFVLASGVVALVALRRYDINYYLTYHPPAFLVAAALIGLLVAALAGLLLVRLSGWAIALHLVLFGRAGPRAAFGESARLLAGRRLRVVGGAALWALIRAALFAGLAALIGALLDAAPELAGDRLRLAVGTTVALLLLWAALNTALGAICNGALADLLTRLYADVTGEARPAPDGSIPRVPLPGLATLAGLATLLVLGGLVFAGSALDRVAGQREVAIIAHRGAAAARPENTMPAIEKALEDGADWVEIDVQETADGEVVVAHDSDLMKLAGVDLKIWNATMADLGEIDIGSWFDPAYADARTPTLREALLAAKGRGRVMIELKYYGHDVSLEERVAGIVEETGMEGQIAVMSLKRAGIEKMQALRPGWRTGLLAARALGDLSRLDVDFLAVNTGQVSLRLIRRAHAEGKQIYVWTVDDPVTMSRMISMGVDGLITNEPALAREVMEARNALSGPERLALWLADSLRLDAFGLTASESDA